MKSFKFLCWFPDDEGEIHAREITVCARDRHQALRSVMRGSDRGQDLIYAGEEE
jgi:hypothetical protein